ncbi:ATP-dependent DNA helicase, partial [Neorhizobium galegae]|uniref:ATP-dependent DNA helicase n=1 Tax=Neorhizobium galegae TaxID=399 RepID=UPI001FD8C15B
MGSGVDSFAFLQQFWPDLAELGRKAEQAEDQEPDLVAIRLRGLTEAMVLKLLNHLGLSFDPNEAHFDRLVQIENADLLDARLMSKFHTIRKVGNNAAHNCNITNQQASSLLEDAWSLSSWFCRFMRPDVQWFTPMRRSAVQERIADASPPDRQPTVPGGQPNVLRFPEERVRRIHEQVARAMGEVDPRIRQLRTRITLHEAFTETLSGDQSACLDQLQAFLADPKQRVFLLKGYAGTGKTFLAKGITEFLAAQGRAFRLAAPTGRAAKIISEKTGREARTAHSQIYDFGDLREYTAGDDELGSETFKFYAKIRSNQDQANAVYIVDEASLLSDVYSESEFFRSGTGYLLHDLISYVGFNHGETDRKIIFVGDPAQLPPVGMYTSPALDAEYLRQHFGLKAVGYELKDVLRQKADSGVIRNVMPLRESLSAGSFSSLGFVFDDDVQRLRADDILPLYMSSRTESGPMASIVIARSNSEAADLNRSIRGALFPGR